MVASEPLRTSRLQDFDYGQPGLYFVTICTHSRVPWFGEVDPSGMRLSEIGHAAQAAWNAVPDHFPDVCLDECCVMPDHVHGLLEITAPAVRTSPSVGMQNSAESDRLISAQSDRSVSAESDRSISPESDRFRYGPVRLTQSA